MGTRFIAALRFDAGVSFEEYSRVTSMLIELGYRLEILNDEPTETVLPKWNAQQIKLFLDTK
ncbi:hypothetical protein LCGC14_2064300 [marine sediment metagenome]|uniref:Uncharacterized protein n=1 Tax=marine sediment metagenome TaxID=412755 RepID=A0A0F9EK46_9ZZZZ